MDTIFTINEKTYKAKEFGFGIVCDLEQLGVPLESLSEKPMSFMCAYFAICSGLSLEDAKEEINQHVINGGSFETLSEVMKEKMETSGFFQAFNRPKNEEKTTKNPQKKK